MKIVHNGRELIFQFQDKALTQITPYFDLKSNTEIPLHSYMVGEPGAQLHVKASNAGIARMAVATATQELRDKLNGTNLPVADINVGHTNKMPDYADIQRLENLAWSDESFLTNYQEYAREYCRLAMQFTEDVLQQSIEQFNAGKPW